MSSPAPDQVSVVFTKLIIPPTMDLPEAVLDLKYAENTYRFKYPQDGPLIFPINDPLHTDNRIYLTVLVQEENKYKKIARAAINLYKKYFNSTNHNVTKWIHLELLTENKVSNYESSIVKTLNNIGKVFMNLNLVTPQIDPSKTRLMEGHGNNKQIYNETMRADLKLISITKDHAMQNKTDKFKSVIESNNAYLRNLKNKKSGDHELFEDIPDDERAKDLLDGLSEVEESCIVDGKDEEDHVEITSQDFHLDKMSGHLKTLFDRNAEELLPKEEPQLKSFCGFLTHQFNNFSKLYIKDLDTVDYLNKEMQDQTKEYFSRYKELKKSFLKERISLHQKQESLQKESNENVAQNTKYQNAIKTLNEELTYVKRTVGFPDNKTSTDGDVSKLAEILGAIRNGGINIFDGMSENDSTQLKNLLRVYGGQQYTNNLKLQVQVEKTIAEFESDMKIRHVDVKHEGDNVYVLSKVSVGITIKLEKIYVLEKSTGSEWILDDWLLHNFKLTADEKKKAHNYGANQLKPKSQLPQFTDMKIMGTATIGQNGKPKTASKMPQPPNLVNPFLKK